MTAIDETVLAIQIVSEDLEFSYKRDFSWYVSSYNSTNCTIQIVWESPPWISSTTVRDKLTLHVIDLDKFIEPRRKLDTRSKEAILLEKGDWEIECPPQDYPGETAETIIAVTETTGEALKFYVLL